jgi:hypothetical protein
VETLSAGVAGTEASEVAEFAGVASLDSGAAEELAGLAPVPNCPARNTWAALASFDLMSCAGAGAGLVWAVDCAAADGVAGEVDDADVGDADVDGEDATEDVANALLATGAALLALLR